MASLLNNIVYYRDNEALLTEILDQVVESSGASGEQPAFEFAALVDALGRDPEKAITLAALAVMRLAQRPGGGS